MLWREVGTLLGMAALLAVVILTVSDSHFFEPLRTAIKKWKFLHALVACRYCFSHWAAAALLIGMWQPMSFGTASPWFDLLITWGSLIALGNLIAGAIVWIND